VRFVPRSNLMAALSDTVFYLAVRQRKCRESGKDIFVHASALEAAGIRTLNEGDRVSFVLEDDKAVGTGSELKKI